jgi:mevalonate kinase
MRLLDEKDPQFIGYFQQIHENVLNGYNAIQTNDYELPGKLMDRHQAIERRIGASTKTIDAMVEAAKRAGAWGAKQIGAGGGGCMIALDPENAFSVISAAELGPLISSIIHRQILSSSDHSDIINHSWG